MTSTEKGYLSSATIGGYELLPENGNAGVLKDVLFTEIGGAIRYVVFDNTRWLPRDYRLLNPDDLGRADHQRRRFQVNLSDEAFNARPQIDADPPVSKQDDSLTGIDEGKGFWSLFVARRRDKAANAKRKGSHKFDPNLRSVMEVIGYTLEGRDGTAGTIADLLFDETDWHIRYVGIATSTLLDRQNLLLPFSDVIDINWQEKIVSTALLRQQLDTLPSFNPDWQIQPTPAG